MNLDEMFNSIITNKIFNSIDAITKKDDSEKSSLDKIFEKTKELQEKINESRSIFGCELVGNLAIGGKHLLSFGITLEWGISMKFALQVSK